MTVDLWVKLTDDGSNVNYLKLSKYYLLSASKSFLETKKSSVALWVGNKELVLLLSSCSAEWLILAAGSCMHNLECLNVLKYPDIDALQQDMWSDRGMFMNICFPEKKKSFFSQWGERGWGGREAVIQEKQKNIQSKSVQMQRVVLV